MNTISAHGAAIPAIGLGTWELRGAECTRAVVDAIAAGYRHVDTAASYGNEEAVGAGIKASGIARDEIFVTTKVPESSLADDACRRSVEASLRRLGLDRVDLVLIHWPNRRMSAAAMIRALSAVKRQGLARHIGVSNFNATLLEEAWRATDEPIVANQCEYHPYLNQDRLLAACRKVGTAFVSYCPLGRTMGFNETAIAGVASAKQRTPAQIVLRWHFQQDVAVIPKSRSAARLKENLDVFGFSLTDAEMAAISALTVQGDRICDASWPRWDS